MVTPASLYILRSFLNGSIETLVRHAFILAACSSCAARCSGVCSPRPRPPPPRPRPAAGGASPRGAALHGSPFQDLVKVGGGADGSGAAPRRPPPSPRPPPPPPRPAAAGAPAKLSTGPP